MSAPAIACSGGGSSTTGGVPATADAGPEDAPDDGLEGALDSGPAVVGCDAGVTASGCGFLTVTLQGGLSASDCCYACGSGTDGFSWSIDQDLASFEINFPQGQTPIEQTGTFPLDYVWIALSTAEGGNVTWQTPPGACTVTITRSVCVVAQPLAQDWLTGSGRCIQPAEPSPGNPSVPVTIGDFTFRGYVLIP